MPTEPGPRVDMQSLRIGLFVHLDQGWMNHPFPFNSFKISSARQIETLRGLGLTSLRYSPDKSDPPPPDKSAMTDTVALPALAEPSLDAGKDDALALDNEHLRHCHERFANASRTCRLLAREADIHPDEARQQAEAVVKDMVNELAVQTDSCLRLLSDPIGDRTALHSVNVAVLCLLLGRAMSLPPEALRDLGLAAVLHDVGKLRLPDRIRWRQHDFTGSQWRLYREHVAFSATLAERMGVPEAARRAIVQHHEMADGSGFPQGCRNADMSGLARILALVNHYDNLCNPANPVHAMTPHEALSLIFTKHKTRFDPATMSAFIRLMGVYPPGSVVELSDRRHAIVTSVNASHPLRPRVLVHDGGGGRDRLLPLDLARERQVDVLRSLHPSQLPPDSMQLLAPQRRVCYYFEPATDAAGATEVAP
jgi:putative nucleotidyltransferase with HDIG domain